MDEADPPSERFIAPLGIRQYASRMLGSGAGIPCSEAAHHVGRLRAAAPGTGRQQRDRRAPVQDPRGPAHHQHGPLAAALLAGRAATAVSAFTGDARHRLLVRPGLTGLWQISGRSDLSWDETLRLDLKYVDTWSLRLDLLILARTPAAVLRGNGAY